MKLRMGQVHASSGIHKIRTSVAILFCATGILALLQGSCAAVSDPYILKVGARPYADKLFTRQEIVKYAAGQFEKAIEIKTFVTDGKAKITKIKAINFKKHGAMVKVLSGGPGYTYVTLQFESEMGQGLHYMFQMYARYQ